MNNHETREQKYNPKDLLLIAQMLQEPHYLISLMFLALDKLSPAGRQVLPLSFYWSETSQPSTWLVDRDLTFSQSMQPPATVQMLKTLLLLAE